MGRSGRVRRSYPVRDVPRGRTVYLAPRTDSEGLGYREVTAAESEKLVHPDDQPPVRKAIEPFLAGKSETPGGGKPRSTA